MKILKLFILAASLAKLGFFTMSYAANSNDPIAEISLAISAQIEDRGKAGMASKIYLNDRLLVDPGGLVRMRFPDSTEIEVFAGTHQIVQKPGASSKVQNIVLISQQNGSNESLTRPGSGGSRGIVIGASGSGSGIPHTSGISSPVASPVQGKSGEDASSEGGSGGAGGSGGDASGAGGSGGDVTSEGGTGSGTPPTAGTGSGDRGGSEGPKPCLACDLNLKGVALPAGNPKGHDLPDAKAHLTDVTTVQLGTKTEDGFKFSLDKNLQNNVPSTPTREISANVNYNNNQILSPGSSTLGKDIYNGGAMPTSQVTTPSSGVATVTAPEVAAPTVIAPQVAVPAITAPEIAAPTVIAPQVAVPAITAPEIAAPTAVAPQVAVPTITAPEVATPTVTAPVNSVDLNNPALQNNLNLQQIQLQGQ